MTKGLPTSLFFMISSVKQPDSLSHSLSNESLVTTHSPIYAKFNNFFRIIVSFIYPRQSRHHQYTIIHHTFPNKQGKIIRGYKSKYLTSDYLINGGCYLLCSNRNIISSFKLR
uniref:Uncharacterized protein n=1 Tax=Cacopsylla melanoneura TaxID=428564 RepID=A0A8D8RN47_9HEMI